MTAAADRRLGQLVLSYLTQRARNDLRPGSVRAMRYTLVHFAHHAGWDLAPRRLTVRHVERWMARESLAAGTVRSQLSMVRTFCQWMVRNGHATRNPVDGVRSPRQPRYLPRGLRTQQVADALDHCPDVRLRLVVTLMVEEGLRCAEVAALQRGDLDTSEWTVRVTGKGGHERILPITTASRACLAAYLGAHPAAAGPLVRSYSHPERGISPKYVSKLVGSTMHGAGVAESAHSLRHTAASDVLRGGANLRDVQAMLGHTSIATTERYLPLIVGDLRQAMEGRDYRGGPSPTGS